MIGGVVTGIRFYRRLATADNPPGASVACPWRFYRVLAVKTALTLWQLTLKITENSTILGVRKWTSGTDQALRSLGFKRQRCQRDRPHSLRRPLGAGNIGQ